MRTLWHSLVGLVVAVGVMPVMAEESPLAFFPETTALVIRLQEPDRTLEKAAELAEAVQPGTGLFVNEYGDRLGELISNPGMIGVDQTKDWYVGVVLSEAGKPVPVFAIPATDTAALVDSIDEEMNTVVHDHWVLYVEKPAEIPAVGSANITSVLNGPAAELFQQAQIGLFLNTSHLTATYATEVAQLQDRVAEGLNQLQFNSPPNVDMSAAIAIYREVARMFFRVLEDSTHLTIAVTFGAEGVQFEDYLVVKEGTGSDTWLAAHPPGDLSLLRKLPKGQQAYYGVSGITDGLLQKLLSATSLVFPEGEQRNQVNAAVQKLEGVHFNEIVGSLKMGGSTSFMTATGIAAGELGENFKAVMRELQTLSSGLETNGIKQTSGLRQDAEQIGDLKVDVMTFKQEVVGGQLDPLGIQKQLNERMFGPDGIETRILYQPNRIVTSTGSLKELEATLKRLDDSNADSVGKLLGALPQPANAVALIDVAMFYGEIFKIMGSTEGLPFEIDPSLIDNLNLTQSYLGLAAVTEPHAARFRLELPVEQLQNCIKLGTAIAITIQQQQPRN